MSNYTAELRTIIDNGFNIFDFEYVRNPEALVILANEKLQDGFINHYYFREVGFETLERFKQRLKTQWLESIENFDKLLIAYNQKINSLSNNTAELETLTIFKDTPQNTININEQLTHATNITKNTSKSKGASGITEIELLELYHDKLKDIVTEFYDSFDNLFMQIF